MGLCSYGAGNFVAAWMRDDVDNNFSGDAVLRRFDASGAPLGGEVIANQYLDNRQSHPALACEADGSLIVTWSSYFNACQRDEKFDVKLRRFDAGDVPLGPEVNVYPCLEDPGGTLGVAVSPDPLGGWSAVFDQQRQLLNGEISRQDVFVRLSSEPDPVDCHIGNGVIDTACGETCDDGGTESCDGCSRTGAIESGYVCGDGTANATCGEQCDDGTPAGGDGCAQCRFEETVTGTLSPGGSLSSDGEADGATEDDPLEMTLQSPTGGAITIVETAATAAPPTGFRYLDYQVNITAPPASVAAPLVLTFEIDASLVPPNQDLVDLVIERNGAGLPDCTGAPQAIPDPCVESRASLPSGDAVITVLTSAASQWTFGLPLCGPRARVGCRPAGKARIALEGGVPNKQKLLWSWAKGAVPAADLGDLASGGGIALCGYDQSGRVLSVAVSGAGTCDGEPCWQPAGAALRYGDTAATADGVIKAKLKPSKGAKGKLQIKGKGAALPLPALPLQLPLQTQFIHSDGRCWKATFVTPTIKNETGSFKAKR